MNTTACIAKIQKFCTHDGPGVRTTVFFKGCPLHCAWCHNPETQSFSPQLFYNASLCVGCGGCAAVCAQGCHRLENGGHVYTRSGCLGCLQCAAVCPAGALEISGNEMSVQEILEIVEQDRVFYGRQGGLTLSGGEPMAQPEAALALLTGAKARGLHTAMETCGVFPENWIEKIASATDLFLWDFKDSDPRRHQTYTGLSNGLILRNLRTLDAQTQGKILLRCILVQGVNLEEAHLNAIARLYGELRHVVGVELIPYHTYGGGKSVALGDADSARPAWVPPASELRKAAAFLRRQGVRCACHASL